MGKLIQNSLAVGLFAAERFGKSQDAGNLKQVHCITAFHRYNPNKCPRDMECYATIEGKLL